MSDKPHTTPSTTPPTPETGIPDGTRAAAPATLVIRWSRARRFAHRGAVLASAAAMTAATLAITAPAGATTPPAQQAGVASAGPVAGSAFIAASSASNLVKSDRTKQPKHTKSPSPTSTTTETSTPTSTTTETSTPTSTATETSTPTPTTTETSTPTPIGGWAPTTAMPSPSAGRLSALLPSGQVLVVGGAADGSSLLYNPATATWTVAAAPPTAGGNSAITLADGRVLVVGGYASEWLATTKVYDPSTDSWSTGPNMPTVLAGRVAAGLFPDGRVIVAGVTSTTIGAPVAAALYDPTTNAWTTLPVPAQLTQFVSPEGVMLPNGTFFTTFGPGGSVYNPATNAWTYFGNPPNALPTGVAIALMPSGNVMFAGGSYDGFGDPTPVRTVWEINPTTGVWTTDENLPRNYVYRSPYLYDGSELVALGNGGILATGGILDTDLDYVYGPATPTWTSTPGRNAHGGTIITLANGSVLVAGGYVDTAGTSAGTITAESFIFTP